MKEYFFLLVSTVLVNNFVLVQFLGLCPFMGVSQKSSAAFGMGAATCFVMTITSALTYLVDSFILQPNHLGYLQTISFILVIACVVQFIEIVLKKVNRDLYQMLGIYLPLITTNCIVLGLSLLNSNLRHNFTQSVMYGFGAGLGFLFVMVLFSTMREKIEEADVPAPFRGAAIAMLAAGIMSMAFMGFSGLIK
ncbi:MAG: electron transport complex subunit RsxA [Succinivibrionaceae bacterium]|nr:electron transport complex subunit RsxA [Succinivibrionaceae bacterium]